ncbi:MAG: sulfite exporter TauE/SafE family protein [Planctomycetota bacterium]
MEQEILKTIVLGLSFFIVAVLYSSVGHGGASGYLLILSFLAFTPVQMSACALLLNVLVSGLSFYSFYKCGYFSFRFALPFIAASIPAAFLGGLIKIPAPIYSLLLGVTLLFIAIRLVFEFRFSGQPAGSSIARSGFWIAGAIGIAVGLLSGIIGIGGGIILSPVILLMGWADVRQTAATSAFFILVNSLAGLSARFIHTEAAIALPQVLLPYVVIAFGGGLVGSYLGARRFSSPTLKRILAIVLSGASVKLIIAAL